MFYMQIRFAMAKKKRTTIGTNNFILFNRPILKIKVILLFDLLSVIKQNGRTLKLLSNCIFK